MPVLEYCQQDFVILMCEENETGRQFVDGIL